MREIGGYIELDRYTGSMLREDGIKLNSGRNALEYLILSKGIKKLLFPKFMCDSCNEVLKRNNVVVRYYSIGLDFKPVYVDREDDEYFYIVNYYGQLSDDYINSLGENVIVDNAQAYFNEPLEGFDTIYTCRKFFGVADGAILYTESKLNESLSMDESFERMHFLLGRYERTASEFYNEYVENNHLFNEEQIKQMSRLTENLLHGIDYDKIKQQRTGNFSFLNEELYSINKLNLNVPKGAFMYPLYVENGATIRKKLQQEKIYIPILWPSVFEICQENELEYDMANNILPLPIDQRYREEDMRYMISMLRKHV